MKKMYFVGWLVFGNLVGHISQRNEKNEAISSPDFCRQQCQPPQGERRGKAFQRQTCRTPCSWSPSKAVLLKFLIFIIFCPSPDHWFLPILHKERSLFFRHVKEKESKSLASQTFSQPSVIILSRITLYLTRVINACLAHLLVICRAHHTGFSSWYYWKGQIQPFLSFCSIHIS